MRVLCAGAARATGEGTSPAHPRYLTIKDIDGAPNVGAVNTRQVMNGSLAR